MLLMVVIDGLTQTTSSVGLMSPLSRMAFSTAPPSLPVALVRASILTLVYLLSCL